MGEDSLVRVQEAEFARLLAGDLPNDAKHDVALCRVVGKAVAFGRLCERLEMCPHRIDFGNCRRDCALDLIRYLVSLLECELARELEVERNLCPASHVQNGDVVHLPK